MKQAEKIKALETSVKQLECEHDIYYRYINEYSIEMCHNCGKQMSMWMTGRSRGIRMIQIGKQLKRQK